MKIIFFAYMYFSQLRRCQHYIFLYLYICIFVFHGFHDFSISQFLHFTISVFLHFSTFRFLYFRIFYFSIFVFSLRSSLLRNKSILLIIFFSPQFEIRIFVYNDDIFLFLGQVDPELPEVAGRLAAAVQDAMQVDNWFHYRQITSFIIGR